MVSFAKWIMFYLLFRQEIKLVIALTNESLYRTLRIEVPTISADTQQKSSDFEAFY